MAADTQRNLWNRARCHGRRWTTMDSPTMPTELMDGEWPTHGQPRYPFRASCSGEVPVMAGPEDEIAAGAAGHGRLRASHADREQVIGTLKAAFVHGMLAKDEFDQRVGHAFASRTRGELAALTADLPVGLTEVRPPGKAVRARARP